MECNTYSEMEKPSFAQQPLPTEMPAPETPEPVHIYDAGKSRKKERADDVALTQCILCVVTVLCMFGLYWLKPAWYTMVISQYQLYRDAPPVAWIEAALQALQQWLHP